MKNFRRVLALAAAVALAAGMAPAAKAAEAEETTEAAAVEAAAEETTAAAAEESAAEPAAEITTVEAGKLYMATNASFPPYEMVADDGSFEGIDVEVAGLIAEKLGLELVVDDMDFGSVITSVQTGKDDIAMAGLTVTDERKENVDFTTTYAQGIQVIIVKDGSEIASVDDLAGKVIGCQESTTGYIYCSDEFGEENVVAFPNGANAVQALLSDKVDCVVIDNNPAQAFVSENEGLVILDTAYAEEDYAIGVNKENTALRDAIDTALQELIADGTVQTILDKYIKAE